MKFLGKGKFNGLPKEEMASHKLRTVCTMYYVLRSEIRTVQYSITDRYNFKCSFYRAHRTCTLTIEIMKVLVDELPFHLEIDIIDINIPSINICRIYIYIYGSV